jgi:hypothetical protein
MERKISITHAVTTRTKELPLNDEPDFEASSALPFWQGDGLARLISETMDLASQDLSAQRSRGGRAPRPNNLQIHPARKKPNWDRDSPRRHCSVTLDETNQDPNEHSQSSKLIRLIHQTPHKAALAAKSRFEKIHGQNLFSTIER